MPPASKEHDLLSASDKSKTIVVDVRVNDIAVEMELDTGVSQSIMSSETFNRLFSQETARPVLRPVNAKLQTYTNELISAIGSGEVKVTFNDVT